MTPRRIQVSPVGPGSRSTEVTWCPRRARAAPSRRPVGPDPTMSVLTAVLRYTDDELITLIVTSKDGGVKVSEARRPYRSTLREEQARATQRAVVSAARDLFVDLGWSRTTIDAVAARAGVSRKTVFTSVGGKAA